MITQQFLDYIPATPYIEFKILKHEGDVLQVEQATKFIQVGTELDAKTLNNFVAELNNESTVIMQLASSERDTIVKLGKETSDSIVLLRTNSLQALEDLSTKLTNAFNNNSSSLVDSFNANATEKTNTYNSNASEKFNAYNSNDTAKTEAYNNNATLRVTQYNNNADTRYSEYNTNADQRYSEYDVLATTTIQQLQDLINIAKSKADLVNGKVPMVQIPKDALMLEVDRHIEDAINAIPLAKGVAF